MFDFLKAVPVVGEALSFLGNRHADRQQRLAQQNANDQNYAQQKEFAQMGIRWRVEDAKAAGLHPLYALGGSGASYSPAAQPVMTGDSWRNLGQNVSRAAQALSTPDERAINNARLKVLESEAEKNFALASAARSEEQRAWLGQHLSKPLNLDGMGLRANPLWGFDGDVRSHRPASNGTVSGVPELGAVKVKPDEQVSARKGMPQTSAGTHPAMREYTLSPGFRMQLPYSEEGPSESLENIPLLAWPSLIAQNSRLYGGDWFQKFTRYVLGMDPDPGRKFSQVGSDEWRWRHKGGYGRGPGRSQ